MPCPIIDTNTAIKLLCSHEIVAIPTETVYGLFGLATSSLAIQKVYLAKNRPADNPLICHFWSIEQMLEYVQIPSDFVLPLLEYFGPAPLTLVLPLLENTTGTSLRCVSAGLSTVCCRIPDHPIALEILKQVNIPLFGPSANTSTRVSGVFAKMIQEDLGDNIAGIVDGGFCPIGLESTIIDVTMPNIIKILRPGVIGSVELKKSLVQNNFVDVKIIENATSKSVTPGAKYRHYSPKTKIILLDELGGNQIGNFDKVAIIIGLSEFLDFTLINLDLGSKYDLTKVCTNLFYNLHLLDKNNFDQAFFDKSSYDFIYRSDSSVAKAILNRLNKVLGL